MANEIQMGGPGTGRTCYARIHNQTSGYIWSTSGGTGGGFEIYTAADVASYSITMSEQGATNFYVGNFPPAVPPGVYSVEARQQLGGSAVEGDPRVGGGDIQWNGSKVFALSDIPISGFVVGIRLQRGVMVQNFGLYLKSAADHVTPFTSGIVSGQIIRDGGLWGALQSGAIAELGNGFYNLQALTSGDLNANSVDLLFTANGVSGGSSDPLPMSIILQRSSGA